MTEQAEIPKLQEVLKHAHTTMNSVDKVIEVYFHGVAAEAFEFRGKVFSPKPLFVSPAFFHKFGCHLGCGGCCKKFTLDFIPGEKMPQSELDKFHPRSIDFNGKSFEIISKTESTSEGWRCDYLNRTNGGCEIHEAHPISCDFAGLMINHFQDHSWLGVRHFGRRWAFTKIDDSKYGICTVEKEATAANRDESIRRMKRLKVWTDHFGLKTHIDAVIEWALEDFQTKPVVFVTGKDGGSIRCKSVKEANLLLKPEDALEELF